MGQRWTPERKAQEAERRAHWKGMAEAIADVRGDELPLDRATAKLYKADAFAVIMAADEIIGEEIQVMFKSGELTSDIRDENDAVLRDLEEKLATLEQMMRRLQDDDEDD